MTTGKDNLTRAERIFVRINVAQTILAVAGVFTGAVALYAALNESASVRRQLEASVWPIVQVTTTDFLRGDEAGFTVSMTNTGVGPARIKAMRVRVRGEAAADWTEAFQKITGEAPAFFARTTAMGRVIAAGETVEILSTSDPELVRSLAELAGSNGAQIDYCYCSIFQDCWLTEASANIVDPARVRQCPDYGADQFQG